VLERQRSPVRDTLVEVWQAKPAGRYWHEVDTPTRPRSTPTSPASALHDDAEGRYRFVTVRPGAYPWGNHFKRLAPRPHPLSRFRARFTQRLITQCISRTTRCSLSTDLQLGSRSARFANG